MVTREAAAAATIAGSQESPCVLVYVCVCPNSLHHAPIIALVTHNPHIYAYFLAYIHRREENKKQQKQLIQKQK